MSATQPKAADLEREVEASRERVSRTLDELQREVAGTVDEWKERLSPSELSRELKTYASDASKRMVTNVTSSIETRVRENPAAALATGALAAYPMYRLARKIPLPVYLMGAGVALMRPLGRAWEHGSDAFRDLTPPSPANYGYGGDPYLAQSAQAGAGGGMDAMRERVTDGARQVLDTAKDVGSTVAAAVSGAVSSASDTAQDAYVAARDAASGAYDSARGVASGAYDTAVGAASGAYESAAGTASDLSRQAADARRRAAELSRKAADVNPWVIGGLGLATAAVLLASAPAGRREARIAGRRLGSAGASAGGFAAERFNAAREAVSRAYEVARREAQRRGLTAEEADKMARSFVEEMTAEEGRPQRRLPSRTAKRRRG